MFLIHLAQKSFINSLTNYSSTGEESLATRGSVVLGEFDNYFKNAINKSNSVNWNNQLGNNNSSTNMKPKPVSIVELKIDEMEEIEEIDFF